MHICFYTCFRAHAHVYVNTRVHACPHVHTYISTTTGETPTKRVGAVVVRGPASPPPSDPGDAWAYTYVGEGKPRVKPLQVETGGRRGWVVMDRVVGVVLAGALASSAAAAAYVVARVAGGGGEVGWADAWSDVVRFVQAMGLKKGPDGGGDAGGGGGASEGTQAVVEAAAELVGDEDAQERRLRVVPAEEASPPSSTQPPPPSRPGGPARH